MLNSQIHADGKLQKAFGTKIVQLSSSYPCKRGELSYWTLGMMNMSDLTGEHRGEVIDRYVERIYDQTLGIDVRQKNVNMLVSMCLKSKFDVGDKKGIDPAFLPSNFPKMRIPKKRSYTVSDLVDAIVSHRVQLKIWLEEKNKKNLPQPVGAAEVVEEPEPVPEPKPEPEIVLDENDVDDWEQLCDE